MGKVKPTQIDSDSKDNLKTNPYRNPFSKKKEEKQRRQKKKARIIVRNVSYKCNETELKKYMEQWGTVEEVNLLKRPDGKLVGCAFVQYEKTNEATKAILKGNGKDFLGRAIFIDWAVGKDEYKPVKKEVEPKSEEPSQQEADVKEEFDSSKNENDESEGESSEESDDKPDDSDMSPSENDTDDEDSENEKDHQKAGKRKQHLSDVTEGRTVFIKNVPFDATDDDVKKLSLKFGPVNYAIINRETISGHSKGTAFVKFQTKESADLCLKAGPEFILQEHLLQPFPALSKNEIKEQNTKKSQENEGKESRNLYLAREGLIMAGSKSAEGVSVSDMKKRHQLELLKAQVLKNLNRFVSRNRLSIHNLPPDYDNEKLKQMVITHTGFRPHECRVMRENKITPEHPQGKSKGFGFMSFSTHVEALTALRKLNNNPTIFKPNHRPIVAFSIEDRAVHKIREKRAEKSRISNPLLQNKVNGRKSKTDQRASSQRSKAPVTEKPEVSKQQTKKRKTSRELKSNGTGKADSNEPAERFVGTTAKTGESIQMRSTKKIAEQAQLHKKRVKANKRKEKQRRIQQIHLKERQAEVRPKQGRKIERDSLDHLVNKYKHMIGGGSGNNHVSNDSTKKANATLPKRTKWYKE